MTKRVRKVISLTAVKGGWGNWATSVKKLNQQHNEKGGNL